MRANWVLAAASLGGQLVSFLSLPVLTRAYGPTEHGDYALFTTYVVLLCSVNTLGLSFSILNQRTSAAALRVTRVCDKFLVFGALLIGTGLGISAFFFRLDLYYGLAVLASASGATFISTRVSLYIRMRAHGAAAVLLLVSPSMKVAGQAGLHSTLSINGLIFFDALSRLGISSILLKERIFRRRAAIKVSAGTVWRRNKEYSIYWLPKVLLDNLNYWAPVAIVAIMFDAATAGFFGIAQRLFGVILSVNNQSFVNVFHQRIASRSLPQNLRKLMTPYALLAAAMSVVFYALLICYGDVIFVFVFGESWLGIDEYLRILLPMYAVLFVYQYILRIAQVQQKQRLCLMINVLQAIAVAVISVVLQIIDASSFLFFQTYVITMILTMLIGSYLITGYR